MQKLIILLNRLLEDLYLTFNPRNKNPSIPTRLLKHAAQKRLLSAVDGAPSPSRDRFTCRVNR
jgi:hypothetical protein